MSKKRLGIYLPDEDASRLAQMCWEKHNKFAFSQEIVLAVRLLMNDYDLGKKQFLKVREIMGKKKGEMISGTEVENSIGNDRSVLSRLLRHGFIKKAGENQFELMKTGD